MRVRAVVVLAAAVLGGLIPAVAAAAASDSTTSNSTSQGDGVWAAEYLEATSTDTNVTTYDLRIERINDNDPAYAPGWYVQARRQSNTSSPDGFSFVTDEVPFTPIDPTAVHVDPNGKTVVLDPVIVTSHHTETTSAAGAAATTSDVLGTTTLAGFWRVRGNDQALNGSFTFGPGYGCNSADHYTDTARPTDAMVTMFNATRSQTGPYKDISWVPTIDSFFVRGTGNC